MEMIPDSSWNLCLKTDFVALAQQSCNTNFRE